MLKTAKLFLGAALLAVGVGSLATAEAALPYSVSFRNFFGAMTFNRPVHFLPYPGQDSAYIVLQQNGKIITVRRVNNEWAKTDSATLAVLNGTSGGNEQGLLGFAFHPNYNANGKYYIYYIASGPGNGFDVIAERTADMTRRPRSEDAQRTILKLADPYDNHNGGTVAFGTDGFLYFGLGDGGNGGDPQNRAQNLDSLFGKFLRLDVDGADAYPADTTRNYAIPGDNPFVGQSGRPEIWAYGVRNPYRWAFHPTNGQLWVGEVGQDAVEEISRVSKGANMGWKIREGNACYSPSSGCASAGLTPAVIGINQPTAQSITGGTFFTGDPASLYHGVYIFGDYVTDSIWAARIVNDSATERVRLGLINNIVSFNRDHQGRVFAITLSNSASVASNNGIVYVLESPDMLPGPASLRPGRRAGIKALTLADLRRHPEAYSVTGLDGRAVHLESLPRQAYKGAVLAQKKGSREPAQLVPLVW
jgi:glucose/arabinose dehydrogenase